MGLVVNTMPGQYLIIVINGCVDGEWWLTCNLKTQQGTQGVNWDDNIKMDLKEVGWDCVYWVHLMQDRHQWYTFVYVIMNLLVP